MLQVYDLHHSICLIVDILNLVYYTGSAQHPPKQIKFDFFLIHSVNTSIFFSAFHSQPWLTTVNKVRLLEWKGRFDLAMYVSQGCPEPLLSEITNYNPKNTLKGDTTWAGIINRVLRFEDDGHASKLIRTFAHGKRICKPYEGSEKFRIKGDMWKKLANMGMYTHMPACQVIYAFYYLVKYKLKITIHVAIDSVEDTGDRWVRSAGFTEAWAR